MTLRVFLIICDCTRPTVLLGAKLALFLTKIFYTILSLDVSGFFVLIMGGLIHCKKCGVSTRDFRALRFLSKISLHHSECSF